MNRQTYSMTQVAPTVSAIMRLPAPAQAIGVPMPEIVSDFPAKCPVAVLALDAFGEYAWQLWQREMPYLQSLHAQRSSIIRAVMPSITPVNFATMVAGTDLAGHGVETFRHDFACETLFDIVRRAQGRSAGIGLTGYTGCELLGRCADICGNAGDGTDDAVADTIIACVDDNKPDFLIAQLGKVDDEFHHHGPSSPEVIPMLRDTDARLQRLVAHLKPAGYAVVILSDHGQHDIDPPTANGYKGMHGTDMPEDCLVPCTWA